MADIWSSLIQHAGSGVRTDVLRALLWPMAMLFTGLLGGVATNAPFWLLVTLATLLVLFFFLYFGFYTFFAINDRDALRSERYNLKRLEIEHGVLGDSETGLLEDVQPSRSLPSSATITVGEA